jgi:hypothetical protein
MGGRRGNGEGSVYQRASDGRWLGVATLGYDDEGRPRRKTVSATTRAGVVQKLTQLHRQLDDGLPPPDTQMTVAQLFERWHDDVLRHQVARIAADNYKSIADHHIVPHLGRKKVVQLTPGDVDRLMSLKMDSGLSVSTVRRIRSVVLQALDQAVRWGSVNRNVARLTRGPKMSRKEGRTLSPVQARKLLAALAGHRNQALYELMLCTDLRRGEALGLRWGDVDLRAGVVLVRRQLKREDGQLVTADTKTPRSRRAVNLAGTDGDQLEGPPGPTGGGAAGPRGGMAGHRLPVHLVGRHPDRPAQPLPGVPGDLPKGGAGRLAPPRAPTLGGQPDARPGRQAAGGQRGPRPLLNLA